MHEGGWVMWGLLAFSILGVATAVERMLALRKARLDFDDFSEQLRQALVVEGSIPKAREASRRSPGPVARVAEVALRRFDRTPPSSRS